MTLLQRRHTDIKMKYGNKAFYACLLHLWNKGANQMVYRVAIGCSLFVTTALESKHMEFFGGKKAFLKKLNGA